MLTLAKTNFFEFYTFLKFLDPRKMALLTKIYPQKCGNVDNSCVFSTFCPKILCLNIHKPFCIFINLWISGCFLCITFVSLFSVVV